MAKLTTPHVDPESLVDLLWAAARTGNSESLAHLVSTCPNCFKPLDPKRDRSVSRETKHFEDGDIAALVSNLLLHEKSQHLATLRHLLEQCPRCHLASSSLFQDRGETPVRATPSAEEYQAMSLRLSKRLCDWRTTFAKDEVLAESFLSKLLAMPPERRLLLVRNSERYGSWSLVTKLGEASRASVSKNPTEAVSLASLAVEIAKSLHPWSYDQRVTEDIKAQAWALLGNALRVSNDLKAAEAAFSQAEIFLANGSGLDTVRVEILDLKASLLAGQRKFQEARLLLKEALAVYRDIEDSHLQGRVMVNDAMICREEGGTEEAAEILSAGLPLINSNREPRLVVAAEHNLITYLIDLGRFDEAAARMTKFEGLVGGTANPLDYVRTQWTKGRIQAGLGKSTEAEKTMTRVKEEFLAANLPYDAALVSLELALLFAEQRRLREMKFLALEILPVFARNEIHREALAALTLFGRAAAAEEATVEVVRTTLSSLRKARRTPHDEPPRASNV